MTDTPSSSPEEVLAEGEVQERRDALLRTVQEAFAAEDLGTLRLILNDHHPADLADLFRHLDDEEQPVALQALAEPLAAAVLAGMDADVLRDVAEDIPADDLSGLVDEMAPDDAADVLGDLSEEQSTEVLDLLEGEEAGQVRELLAHPEDTAGGLMTSRFIAVSEDLSAAQAIEQVRAWAEDEDEVFYLYLTDQEGLLSGLVPLKRLLLAPADAPVGTLAKGNPIAVRSDMDQEEIAYIFAEYDLLVLPVVDDAGRLVGVVTVDDIFDVIEEETTEDMYEMAAIPSEERTDRSAAGVVRLRLPWLLVCLGGTLLAGAVIEGFADTLATALALSFFVPAVMAMGGNTGIQTATVTVRSLAIGQEQWGLVGRELRVALGLGVILGVLAWGVASWWTGDVLLGGCVGAAMGAAVVMAVVMGAVVPLVFRRLGIDPAVASGPLITTINDGLSLLLYFGIAAFFL